MLRLKLASKYQISWQLARIEKSQMCCYVGIIRNN